MEAMIEALQGVVMTEPDIEVQPEPTQPDDTTIETQLTEEITALWSDHVRLSGNRRATAKELRQIRASLAARLCQMKGLLCQAGRAGQWRSWLRQQDIPRSTADRLASRHVETLGIDNEANVPSGAISEPGEANADKLANSMWLRVGKLLTTAESTLRFIRCIVAASGLAHEWREEGLVIFKPAPNAAGEPQVPVAVVDSPSPPSDQASTASEETVGAAVVVTASGEAAASAGSGEVL